MIIYTLQKREDRYYLLNQGTLNIDYEIKRLSDCTNFTSVSSNTVTPNQEVEVVFPEDGKYQIIMVDSTADTITLTLNYYINLQLALIDSVFSNVCECGCGCSSCEESNENKLCNLLITRTRIDLYKNLTSPEGTSFYNNILSEVKCLISTPVYCSIAEEIIRGEATCNEELIKQMIALDYLSMYFYDFAQTQSTEDETFVRNKFRTEEIFCCIHKLGIDINNIEQLINNNMGLFTINSGVYENQAPSAVGDNTISVPNRAVTVLTLAMFTTNTTPVYADPENDPVNELRVDTLPADGILYLNGVAVVVSQAIPVADINLGLFTYESPNQDAIDTDSFNFSLSDSGSGIFTS